MIRIYIAAPFFNPKQVALVERIEQCLARMADFVVAYSPRSEGVIVNMTPEEKAANSERMFRKNKAMIETSTLIVAVIDGRDPGTIWEIGYGHAKDRWIITFTDENFGLNLMLAKSVIGHCRSILELDAAIRMFYKGEDLEQFRNFEAES